RLAVEQHAPAAVGGIGCGFLVEALHRTMRNARAMDGPPGWLARGLHAGTAERQERPNGSCRRASVRDCCGRARPVPPAAWPARPDATLPPGARRRCRG